MKWGKPNPVKEGWYLCTIESFDETYVMPLKRVEYPINNFTWYGLNHGEVIASIKFPKPYNKQKR